jgi:DNA-binding LytR/AlgR family response regulator
MNVIIVDDEPLAQDVLETYVNQMGELNLVAKCNNAIEANEVLQNNKIDLMFLDIQMPQLTGTDFLKSLANPPMVVFTTAYSEFAVEGFELNALDYLLKPISMDRFMRAVNKAKEQLELQKGGSKNEEIVEMGKDFFFVKADKKLVRVSFSDIIYIEGLKDYVIIRQESGRVITLQTMKSLEEKLPSNNFRRIHRSFIVNVEKINAVMGNMVEVMEKGKEKHLPIGKNYRDDLLDYINETKL